MSYKMQAEIDRLKVQVGDLQRQLAAAQEPLERRLEEYVSANLDKVLLRVVKGALARG